jgi:hypothetical protein
MALTKKKCTVRETTDDLIDSLQEYSVFLSLIFLILPQAPIMPDAMLPPLSLHCDVPRESSPNRAWVQT